MKLKMNVNRNIKLISYKKFLLNNKNKKKIKKVDFIFNDINQIANCLKNNKSSNVNNLLSNNIILFNYFICFLKEFFYNRIIFFFILRIIISIIFLFPQFIFLYVLSKGTDFSSNSFLLLNRLNFDSSNHQLNLILDVLNAKKYLFSNNNISINSVDVKVKKDFFNILKSFNDFNLLFFVEKNIKNFNIINNYNKKLISILNKKSKNNNNHHYTFLKILEDINLFFIDYKMYALKKKYIFTEFKNKIENIINIIDNQSYKNQEIKKIREIDFINIQENSSNINIDIEYEFNNIEINKLLNNIFYQDNLLYIYRSIFFNVLELLEKFGVKIFIKFIDNFIVKDNEEKFVINKVEDLFYFFFDKFQEIISNKINFILSVFSFFLLGSYKNIYFNMLLYLLKKMINDPFYSKLPFNDFISSLEYFLNKIWQLSFLVNFFISLFLFDEIFILFDCKNLSKYYVTDWLFSYSKPFYIFLIRIFSLMLLNLTFGFLIFLLFLLFIYFYEFYNFFFDNNIIKKISFIKENKYVKNVLEENQMKKIFRKTNFMNFNNNIMIKKQSFFLNIFYYICFIFLLLFVLSIIEFISFVLIICYKKLFLISIIFFILKFISSIFLLLNDSFLLSFIDIFFYYFNRNFLNKIFGLNIKLLLVLFALKLFILLLLKHYLFLLFINDLLFKFIIVLFNKLIIFNSFSIFNIFFLLSFLFLYTLFLEKYIFIDLEIMLGDIYKLV